MITYFIRAVLIMLLPFAANIWIIYLILIFLSVAQSFFVPASLTYTTMFVPKQKRKRFNTFRSVTSSSAFIIGPALAAVMILLTNIEMTLFFTSGFFIIAAVLLCLLPDIERRKVETTPLSAKQVIDDFLIVFAFLKTEKYISFVYLGYLFIMIITYVMDAEEVVFIQSVVGLSEADYSFLLSITGIGSVLGALLLTSIANKLSIRFMIASGMIMTSIGYVIYSLSSTFTVVMCSFILLGFFNSFLNAGALTFYQNNIPVEIMGRVTSIFQLLQSLLQVCYLSIIAILAGFLALKYIIISLSILLFTFTCFYVWIIYRSTFYHYFCDEDEGQPINS